MAKKTKKRQKQMKTPKTRAKYKCPAELENLIELTNLVPIGILMPDFGYEYGRKVEKLREETGDPSPTFSSFEFLSDLIKHLPNEFLEELKNSAAKYAYPLGKDTESERRYRQAFENLYTEYCDSRGSIIRLVQILEKERLRMRNIEIQEGLKAGSITFDHYVLLDWDIFPPPISTVVKRDDAGKLQITGLASLIGKFDDSRLRRCEVCDKIFWAKREDSKTCSLKCLNVLNVRVSRSLTPEEKAERKAKRIANAEQKKKVKEMRSKKDGTL